MSGLPAIVLAPKGLSFLNKIYISNCKKVIQILIKILVQVQMPQIKKHKNGYQIRVQRLKNTRNVFSFHGWPHLRNLQDERREIT